VERFFDIFLSGIALLILSIFFVPISLILRFSGEGEIFFLQARVGKGGKVFKIYKFATMLKDSPNTGTGTVTIKDDPRVLPFGKFLRKTKINELPQLLNIFFGDMSFIGPRPLTLETFNAYSKNTQEILKKVKPGLSGVGAIIFRDEEEIIQGPSASLDFYVNTIAPYKGSLEEWFVLNKNLKIYFIAIFMTVWVVLFPKAQLAWKIFKNLPEPPKELKNTLNYIDNSI
jgi:lipopolysaccharide/colanic/teichoic acid biosynthesis glycosyltransferase